MGDKALAQQSLCAQAPGKRRWATGSINRRSRVHVECGSGVSDTQDDLIAVLPGRGYPPANKIHADISRQLPKSSIESRTVDDEADAAGVTEKIVRFYRRAAPVSTYP
jgi:hypothetical protein